MKTTRVFSKTLKAYEAGKRFIINRGGTRSSKSFSTLQLIYLIAKSTKKHRVVHCVSHSTPHLTDGIVADFDKILTEDGVIVPAVKTKNPNTYRIGNSIIKFLGFDKLGKSLGAARDILFINEANKMDFEIVQQLIVRTTETIFIDYNPSESFWVDEEGISSRKDAEVIKSTFRDNIENLTSGQIDELLEAKKKHDEDVKNKRKGYWWNYWRVYGDGLDGALKGAILTRWKRGTFDESLPFYFGLDWGYTDPFTIVKVAVNEKKKLLYVKQLAYVTEQPFSKVYDLVESNVHKDDVLVCDSSEPANIRELRKNNYNAFPAFKKPGIVKQRLGWIQDYMIILDDSPDIEREIKNYVWADKKSETPVDKFNHAIDAIGYAYTWYRLNVLGR